MKIWIGALWATLFAISCVSAQDHQPLASEEQEAIGVCGANADPVTGVMCKYTTGTGSSYATYVGSQTFERDGLDYVNCSWSVECSTNITPLSDSGATCVSTIGTGCNEGDLTGTQVREYLLPPGTTAAQVDTFCQGNAPDWNARFAFCRTLDHTTEQYEDLCCVARKKTVAVDAP